MESSTQDTAGADLFLFGYGSLLWKQNFIFVEALPCYVTGYERVFYQGSTDHRGVPGAPGRVVTLLPRVGGRVDGLCFRVPAAHKEEALTALDIREKGGYDRFELPCFVDEVEESGASSDERGEVEGGARRTRPKIITNALLYVANEHNEEYLGPDTELNIAEQILKSSGPSGPNREYLFNLDESLKRYGFVDRHVQRISDEAKRLLQVAEEDTTTTQSS